MLINSNDFFIENHRSEKEGSLVHFCPQISKSFEPGIADITQLTLNRLNTLIDEARRIDDNVLTYKDISTVLNININTVRRMIQSLIKKSIIEPVINFKHHQNNRINLYRLRENTFHAPSTDSSYTDELSANQTEHEGLSLATRYNRTLTNEDEFLSIDENSFTRAMFPHHRGILEVSRVKIGLRDVFAREPNQMEYMSHVATTTNNNEQYTIQTKIESNNSQCLEITDIRFIYALVSLTQRYHLDFANLYLNSDTSKTIPNVTPILTQNVRTSLGLAKNQDSNRFIFNKMKQIEGNKFSINIIRSQNNTDEEVSDPIRLFDIIRMRRKSTRGDLKNASPYLYYLKWNRSILETIFLEEHWFLHSMEALQLEPYAFLLYNKARSVLAYKSHFRMDLPALLQFFKLDRQDQKQLFRILIKAFTNSFPLNARTKRRTASPRSEIVECSVTGQVGGIEFTFDLSLITPANPICLVSAKPIHRNSILYYSQNADIRTRLIEQHSHDSNDVSPDSKALLQSNGRGNNAPILFNNQLRLVANNIATDDPVYPSGSYSSLIASNTARLTDIPDNLKDYDLIAADRLRVRISVRKFLITIYVVDDTSNTTVGKYNLSNYHSDDEYNDIVRTVISVSKNSPNHIIERIRMSVDKTQLIAGKNGSVIDKKYFDEIRFAMDLNSDESLQILAKKWNYCKGLDFGQEETKQSFIHHLVSSC